MWGWPFTWRYAAPWASLSRGRGPDIAPRGAEQRAGANRRQCARDSQSRRGGRDAQPPARPPRWVVNLHMAASLLAVILSWFLAHIYFGLHYMRLYYDDTVVEGKLTYQFPQRWAADFWDFMYYSFTIAMCYQTSDVTVTSMRIRRVTLLHAIFSFLFVTAIIGFVVNVISNVM